MGGKAYGGRRVTREEAKQAFDKIRQEIGDLDCFMQLCGSYRRGKETSGDLDIVIIPGEDSESFDEFCKSSFGMQKNGKKIARNGLFEGIQTEFYVASPENVGTFLQMWTGSHRHNIRLRARAKKLGYSMSQYGFRNAETKELVTFASEEEVYKFLNMDYVLPEDR
jgi:DNA polymerase (family 10)